MGVSITVFLDFDINTVSDVISLIMKLDEQSSLKISADKDAQGTFVPGTVRLAFDDPQINDAICSYLEYKNNLDFISYESSDPAVIETSLQSLDDSKKRLLFFNDRIKKSAQ